MATNEVSQKNKGLKPAAIAISALLLLMIGTCIGPAAKTLYAKIVAFGQTNDRDLRIEKLEKELADCKGRKSVQAEVPAPRRFQIRPRQIAVPSHRETVSRVAPPPASPKVEVSVPEPPPQVVVKAIPPPPKVEVQTPASLPPAPLTETTTVHTIVERHVVVYDYQEAPPPARRPRYTVVYNPPPPPQYYEPPPPVVTERYYEEQPSVWPSFFGAAAGAVVGTMIGGRGYHHEHYQPQVYGGGYRQYGGQQHQYNGGHDYNGPTHTYNNGGPRNPPTGGPRNSPTGSGGGPANPPTRGSR